MPPNSVMRQASDGHPRTGSPQTCVFTRMTTNPRIAMRQKTIPVRAARESGAVENATMPSME